MDCGLNSRRLLIDATNFSFTSSRTYSVRYRGAILAGAAVRRAVTRRAHASAVSRMQLESIARSQSLPAALSRRAQMIQRLADGEINSAVARRYRVSRPTVSLWRKRHAEHGIVGLRNELKPGRPRSTGEKRSPR